MSLKPEFRDGGQQVRGEQSKWGELAKEIDTRDPAGELLLEIQQTARVLGALRRNLYEHRDGDNSGLSIDADNMKEIAISESKLSAKFNGQMDKYYDTYVLDEPDTTGSESNKPS